MLISVANATSAYGMSMPEQFSLRWNDFHTNLSHAFHALLEGQDMVDVTLAAGGHYVHAHKLILSVCSPYFKELFKMNPCEHPIVILKDVAHSELRQLLQFMYRGEVHVKRQELSGFLHTAELLQVKGLTNTGRERSESPTLVSDRENCVKQEELGGGVSPSEWVAADEPSSVDDEEPGRSPLKRLLKGALPKNNSQKKRRPMIENREVASNIVDKTEKVEYASDNDQLTDCDNELYHSVLEMPEGVKDGTIKQEGWNCKPGGVKCPSCHRFFVNRYNLKVHIRDKHDTREGTLQCEVCHKRMRNPSCLRVHMYHHRKQAAFLATQIPHRVPVENLIEQKWRSEPSLSPPRAPDYNDQESYTSPVGGVVPPAEPPLPIKTPTPIKVENNERGTFA